jgi:hypothetical protein
VCGASSVSVQRAEASTDDNFPRIVESVQMVVGTIQKHVDAEGVPLAQSSTIATDPTIASLIALLNQLIAQYQALLAAQGGNTTTQSDLTANVTSGIAPLTVSFRSNVGSSIVFGDGTSESFYYCMAIGCPTGGFTINHTYTTPGTYTAVAKKHGTTNVGTKTIVVTGTTPTTPAVSGTMSTTGSISSVAGMTAYVKFSIKGTANGTYIYAATDGGARERINVTNGAWTKVFTSGLSAGSHTITIHSSATSSALKSRTVSVLNDPNQQNNVSTGTGTIAFTSPKAGDVYNIGDTMRIAWDNQNGCTRGFTLKWVHDRNGNATESKGWETGYQILWSGTESDEIMKRGYYDFKIPSIYNNAAGSAAVYNNAIFMRCMGEGDKASTLSKTFRVNVSSSNLATKSTKTDQQLVYGVGGLGSDTFGNIPGVSKIYKTQYMPPNSYQDGTGLPNLAEEGEEINFSWDVSSALSDDDTYVYLSLIQDTNNDGIYDKAHQISYYNTELPSGHTNGNYTWTVAKTMGGVNVTGYKSKIVMSNHPLTTISLNPAESEISMSKVFTIHALSTTGTPNSFHIGTLKVTGDGGGAETTTSTRTYSEALNTCANRVKFNPGTISCYFDGVKLNVAGTI